ncbi:MAG: glycosyltransferase 87 family protein [Alphaproteobacteria bacterium]|nr:glycosyltransferase 87 family protein [Alphaproteobacteria bacterium]
MNEQALTHSSARDYKIHAMTAVMIIGFVTMVVFLHWTVMFDGAVWPYNTFLPAPISRFGDYWGVVMQWADSQFGGIGFGHSYFPAIYLLVHPFAHFAHMGPTLTSLASKGSLIAFLAIFVIFTVWYTWLNVRSKTNPMETIQRVIVFTVMSYPTLFTFQTGNFEAYIFICLALFIYLYQRGQYTLSTLPLAFAIASKVFPGVFLVLFKEALYTIIGIVVFTLLPLFIFEGGLRTSNLGTFLHNLHESQKMYFDLMVMSVAGNHFGGSLYNTFRIVFGEQVFPIATYLSSYSVLALGILLLVSAYVILVEKAMWKRVTLVVICMCLLPYTSTDYKLMHFYLPAWLFINQDDASATKRSNLLYSIGFAILFMPKSYFSFDGDIYNNINAPTNFLVMLGMTAAIFTYGIKHTSWSEVKANLCCFAPRKIWAALLAK